MPSRYEKNVTAQSELVRAILKAAAPTWMEGLRKRCLRFVGVGTNYHAAQMAKIFWRRSVSRHAHASHSFEFVRQPPPLDPGDVVVLLSHRGTKSFTVEAARVAAESGAATVAVTGLGSSWAVKTDYRIDTCEAEDCGAFTKSLTTTLAWLALWSGDEALVRGMRQACQNLDLGPAFPSVERSTDLILLGDMEREWVAREIALKIQETAYLPARAFGLEEFLHGPRISAGENSLVIAFMDGREGRWGAALDYLKAVGVRCLAVEGEKHAPQAGWFWQIFWGQRLTLAVCRGLGINPDDLRLSDPRYKSAREKLAL